MTQNNLLQIKTLIFDLGGVYFTDGAATAIKSIAATYSLTEAQVTEVIKGDLGTQYRIGAITPDEFWQRATAAWNITAPTAEIAAIWLQAYVPIPATIALIDRLQTAGYELLFLSDNAPDRIDYLEKTYHFLQHFQDGVFSHIAGVRKPDPKMYQLVLQKTTTPAAQCLFIDDKPAMLEPARKLGMHVIHFTGPEQLEKDLQSLGLKF
ncbi:MAG: hypothetical protein A3F54_05540 [Candidatus Kerfeldbacteria bacterium RIFCSPHIGHO2_12_FULL_48_17]|uniref:Uncharacterized protein n=1 Tax=Candidatus Kerfeldbacteria bacterium RIFCSPHIGHO2_12_FULL_48_17 TaxID=1798542 RepID=A0A1G2B8F2_9BACT|nr:MAG: hypothetical protein A3F54_05540 [Candidatus Kerfeldbacteria bacterium RIFCSPHIGHO2_12_FULL_48_17]